MLRAALAAIPRAAQSSELTHALRRPFQTVLTMMAPNGFREFEISNTNNLVFFRGVNKSAPTGISVNDGEWHHLAVSIRIDAEKWNINLFVDTAMVAQRTLPTYKEISAGMWHHERARERAAFCFHLKNCG